MSPAVIAGLAVVAAVLVMPRRDAAARRRLLTAPAPGPALAVDEVAGLAERLAGVARAGLPPGRVWGVLAARPGPYAGLAAAMLPWIDAGVPAGRALRAVSRRGAGPAGAAPDLACLAVALEACERAGAPLAASLDGVAAALRAQQDSRREREAALAAPRATATVMTALPAIGLLLGAALGVDTLAVLTGTGAGRVALVLGGTFWFLGRRWTSRLVAAATRAS